MKRLIVATRNQGKVLEIRDRVKNLGFEVSSLVDADFNVVVEEDADTFAGNAIKKALAVNESSGYPALADDSGLEVDALGGRPGVYSARYGGEGLDDRGRYEHLLEELSNVPYEKRSARFQAALAYVEQGEGPQLFHGTVEGKIALVPAGSHGFGYDPVFVPLGYDHTVAELGPEIKNRISHRAKALDAFSRWIARRD